MNEIFDGKKEALILKDQLRDYFSKLSIVPTLGIIQVGDDRLSNVFINEKIKFANYIGVNTKLEKLPSGSSNLGSILDKFNKDKYINAFLLQLPLVGIESEKLYLNKILPSKDIDCLTDTNYSKVLFGDYIVAPGVFLAFKYVFDKLNIPKDFNILVVGAGFVGRLIVNYLISEKFNITIVDKFVLDISKYSKVADVIIFAAGISSLISKDIVKNGVYCINIGAAADFSGHILGGISDDVIAVSKFFVPTIGGIGPLTVAMLFSNLRVMINEKY